MNVPDHPELLVEWRAKCREFEANNPVNEQLTDAEVKTKIETAFKYTARTFWWGYLQQTQKGATYVISFREFWDSEATYPRTVAM